MKALSICLLFTALSFGAMAQKQAGDNTRVVFTSPEPTVLVTNTNTNVNPADRVTFDSPAVTVKKTEPTSANPAAIGAKRVEFTSPAPTSISTGKKDDE